MTLSILHRGREMFAAAKINLTLNGYNSRRIDGLLLTWQVSLSLEHRLRVKKSVIEMAFIVQYWQHIFDFWSPFM
jgi:hypothetical protein